MKNKIMCLILFYLSVFGYSQNIDMYKIDSIKYYDNEILKSKMLTVFGGGAFGLSYCTAIGTTVILLFSPYKVDHTVASVLWIPLVGPTIASLADGYDEPIIDILCLGWSLTEIIGTALLYGGYKTKKDLKQKKYSISLKQNINMQSEILLIINI